MSIDRRSFLEELACLAAGAHLDISRLAFPAQPAHLADAPVTVRQVEEPTGRRKMKWDTKPVGGTFTISGFGKCTRPIRFDESKEDAIAAIAEVLGPAAAACIKFV